MKKKESGFTLIELLIVIAIIGILAAIAIPNLLNAVQRGKQKRSMSDMRTMATAVEAYAVDNNYYPAAQCTGKFTEVVQVGEATTPTPVAPRIIGVSARPTPARPGQPVRLILDGSGACAFTIDYGDGNSDSRSMTLPGSLRHVYSAPGSYTVVIFPDDSQCRGSARVFFEVRR